MTLNLKKKEFQFLLQSLGQIHDTCVLELREDGIHGIASSEDNSMFTLQESMRIRISIYHL